MKINTITTIIFSLITTMAMAQLDRSKIPTPGASPSINLGDPVIHKFSNGLTLMVVENHKLPQVSVSLLMDEPTVFEGDKAGISDITSQLMGKGSQSISKEAFEEEIDFLAAYVDISAQSLYASSLSRYFPRVMELLSSASLQPLFTQQELDKEKAKLLQMLKAGENDASQIIGNLNNALVYGKQHPYGEMVTPQTVANITLDDVTAWHKKYFVPNKAYMIVSGDISFDKAKELVEKYFVKPFPKANRKSDREKLENPSNVASIQIDFVDLPSAVQSEIRVNNLIKLKMSDKDYFPLLMANHILGGDFGSYINMNLREKNGFTYGARSFFSPNKRIDGRFGVSTQVRNEVTAAAVQEIINEVERIRNEYVDEEHLKIGKAKYLGNFIMATEKPETISSYALKIKMENLPHDFYKNYIKNINAVTKEDIKRVANTYFLPQVFRIVIVGKRDEIAPSLEKLTYHGKKIPVNYYNKKGERIQ